MRCRLAMLVRLGTLRPRQNTHYFAKYLSSFYLTSMENDGVKLRWAVEILHRQQMRGGVPLPCSNTFP
jgi:hypothetical protein